MSANELEKQDLEYAQKTQEEAEENMRQIQRELTNLSEARRTSFDPLGNRLQKDAGGGSDRIRIASSSSQRGIDFRRQSLLHDSMPSVIVRMPAEPAARCKLTKYFIFSIVEIPFI